MNNHSLWGIVLSNRTTDSFLGHKPPKSSEQYITSFSALTPTDINMPRNERIFFQLDPKENAILYFRTYLV